MSRGQPVPSPKLEAAVSAGEPLLVLSAHLDDAVLSCGALIESLATRCPLTVATLFTEAGAPPHTYAARSFLKQCSAPDASTLFTDRRTEDRDVLVELGVHHRHLGVPDALFRMREPRITALGRLGRVVPELVHRYPTYRFDIAKGRVSSGDRALITALSGDVSELMRAVGARLVLAPIGVGNHVDHLITRTIGERHTDRVIYYSDFPYDRSAAPDPAFLDRHRLVPWTWDHRIAEKRRLIRGYRTQADALFPGGDIPEQPETYYEAAALRSAA